MDCIKRVSAIPFEINPAPAPAAITHGHVIVANIPQCIPQPMNANTIAIIHDRYCIGWPLIFERKNAVTINVAPANKLIEPKYDLINSGVGSMGSVCAIAHTDATKNRKANANMNFIMLRIIDDTVMLFFMVCFLKLNLFDII